MKVQATKEGFLVYYRSVGDEFEIEDKQFSKNWMRVLEPTVKGQKPKTQEIPKDKSDKSTGDNNVI